MAEVGKALSNGGRWIPRGYMSRVVLMSKLTEGEKGKLDQRGAVKMLVRGISRLVHKGNN